MLDKAGFRRFYTDTQPKLLRWVSFRVKDTADAEDLVQDIYLSFIDSLPLFRGGSSLWTFLVSIAKHEVSDYWRKKYAKKAILTIPFADHFYTEKLYSATSTASEIQQIYNRLLPHQVQILKWKYEDGLNIEQIAHKLKINLKAAESRLFRARAAFRLAYSTAYD
jgi:RNA polymerase sigma-70 factor, ECF subfamily